jgi:hypothetical protein
VSDYLDAVLLFRDRDLAKAAAHILAMRRCIRRCWPKRLARPGAYARRLLKTSPWHQRRPTAPGLSLTRIYPVLPDLTGIETDASYLLAANAAKSISDRGVYRDISRRNAVRLNTLCFVRSLAALAITLPLGAVPAQPAGAASAQWGRQSAITAPRGKSAAYVCPNGYYWVPAGYAKHGKFRPAHCSRRW